MKLVLIVAFGAALTAGASLAQSPPLRGAASPDGSARAPMAGRATAPSASEAQVDAARTRSEARLREREDKARRTLKGICSGC